MSFQDTLTCPLDCVMKPTGTLEQPCKCLAHCTWRKLDTDRQRYPHPDRINDCLLWPMDCGSDVSRPEWISSQLPFFHLAPSIPLNTKNGDINSQRNFPALFFSCHTIHCIERICNSNRFNLGIHLERFLILWRFVWMITKDPPPSLPHLLFTFTYLADCFIKGDFQVRSRLWSNHFVLFNKTKSGLNILGVLW